MRRRQRRSGRRRQLLGKPKPAAVNEAYMQDVRLWRPKRTAYFCFSSLDSGQDIILRRSLLGALKCAFLHLRRLELTVLENFISATCIGAEHSTAARSVPLDVQIHLASR